MNGNFPNLSIYIHIPFCSHKCPYCHFYVILDKDILKDDLLQSLHQEIGIWQDRLKKSKLVSLYFGGGTPTLFGVERLSSMITKIDSISSLSDAEITIEANPENLNTSLLQHYKSIGINRLSIGVQSFDSEELKILDRRHSQFKASQAITEAFNAGIQNISCDLMYELPSQTLDIFKNSLSVAAKLPISHLSLYNLTIEPNTAFFQRKYLKLPDMETGASMYTYARNFLKEHGFNQYEISAFSRNNLNSYHNSGYWNGRPFLGFGPSAFSYESNKRFRNYSNLSRYSKALQYNESPCDFSEELSPSKRRRELIAINLRLLEGLDLSKFESVNGALESDLMLDIEKLIESDLLIRENNIIRLSELGIFHYDTVASELI